MADSGTYDDATLLRRQKIAEAMYADAMKPRKIEHWTQGLAQMAQAGVGGLQLSQYDQQAKANETALAGTYAKLLQGGGGPQTSAAQQTPTGGASMVTPPMGNKVAAAMGPGKIYGNDEPSPLDPPSGADRDNAIRTVLGEAGNQGPSGMQAVASVIRNRAVNGGYGGDTPTGVVTAPNQFEPWNTPGGRQKMASLDPNSMPYQNAGKAVDQAYTGDDPTNGATNFIAPKAQAALGRPTPPWAQGPGQDIGDHRFFGGASAVAQAMTPPAGPAAPAAAPAPTTQPDTRSQIAGLLSSQNPAERKIGMQLAQTAITQSMKPAEFEFKVAGDNLYRTNAKAGTAEPVKDVGRGVKPMTEDQRKEWKVPEGVAAGIDDNGKPVFSQPSNINTVSPVVSGINDRFDAQLKAAQSAPQIISSIHEGRRALDSGAITGMGAESKLALAKIGTMFGLPNESVANTEVARAAVGNQVLESAKTLGANPSNADRDYIEKVKGGSITLDEGSMRRLMDMQERWARDSIKRANESGKKLVSTDPEKLGRFAPMLSVEDPASYEDYVKNNPVKSTAPAKNVDALKQKYGLQ